jgi:ATP-dependent Clp protease ATP-binding subunit ClpA
LTDDAQQAIELAFTELAHTMDCRVGTGHLLLGVARQQEGAGRRTLTDLGVDVDQLSAHLVDLLQASPDDPPNLAEVRRSVERQAPLSSQAEAHLLKAVKSTQSSPADLTAPASGTFRNQSGNSLEQLLAYNQSFVLAVATDYGRHGHDARLAYREGSAGLAHAIVGWDAHKGEPFHEYALSVMRGTIERCVRTAEAGASWRST